MSENYTFRCGVRGRFNTMSIEQNNSIILLARFSALAIVFYCAEDLKSNQKALV